VENRKDPVSLVDLVNFIVKNQFADSVDFLIYIKDLRNRIAHEYIWLWIYHTVDFIEEINSAFNRLKPTIDAVENYLRQLESN